MSEHSSVTLAEFYAIKIPRLTREFDDDGGVALDESLAPKEGEYDLLADLVGSLERERAIYKRLGSHPSIMRFYNLSSADPSIQMDLIVNGDLRHYLAALETPPGKKTQLSWLINMAQTLAYIHQRRVIVADIRLDNLLFDDQLAIKFTDFGESTLVPLHWDLQGDDGDGYSNLTDIGQFGVIMFEIVPGQRCKFDPMQDWKDVGDPVTLPTRDTLPSTSNVWLGHNIEKYWIQEFESTNNLVVELQSVVVDED
ncbi:serine/threonine protein kinase [Fonsecaea pedrosoi]|nr:serine/threonine protein kinase [Fonsecaea pedrosoi]